MKRRGTVVEPPPVRNIKTSLFFDTLQPEPVVSEAQLAEENAILLEQIAILQVLMHLIGTDLLI
jgi:hypothetical protein